MIDRVGRKREFLVSSLCFELRIRIFVLNTYPKLFVLTSTIQVPETYSF